MKQEPSLNQEEYLNCTCRRSWRIYFSPAYHLAGFTYTLYSAMFLSIGIKYTIIIVSLVVLVMHLGTSPPTRLLSGIWLGVKGNQKEKQERGVEVLKDEMIPYTLSMFQVDIDSPI